MKRLLWIIAGIPLCFFVMDAAAAYAAPQFINDSSLGFSAASTIATTTLNVTTNNLIVTGCRHGSTFVAPTNVTDTIGNTFTLIATASDTNDGAMSVYYAISSGSNASDTVGCNFASSVAFRDITVMQYTGISTVTPLDTFSTTSTLTTSTVYKTAPYTTSNANDLIISYVAVGNGTALVSASNNYLIRTDLDNAIIAVGTAQSAVASIQTATSTTWVCAGASSTWMNVNAAFEYTGSSEVELTTSTSWKDPAGVTSVEVQAWGGGGGGGAGAHLGSPGGGGAGGGFAQVNSFSVTPSNSYTVTVGQGGQAAATGTDSWFNTSSTIWARGGPHGGSNGAAGGTAIASSTEVGNAVQSGGNGASGVNDGQGGSGAGSQQDGFPGTASLSVTPSAQYGGGQGAIGQAVNPGFGAGGGGAGGAAATAGTGGIGGGGELLLIYSVASASPRPLPHDSIVEWGW